MFESACFQYVEDGMNADTCKILHNSASYDVVSRDVLYCVVLYSLYCRNVSTVLRLTQT
jgi:hypothetical protein